MSAQLKRVVDGMWRGAILVGLVGGLGACQAATPTAQSVGSAPEAAVSAATSSSAAASGGLATSGLVADAAVPGALASGRLASGAAALTAVRTEIAAAREQVPAVFAAVAALRAEIPSLDRAKRGPFAVVTPALRSLGVDALLPMLEQLLEPEPTDVAWTPTARVAWRVGLLEAVGRLRDGRANPVLQQLLADADEPHVVRAATAALGKLGDPATTESLLVLASRGDPRQAAILAGLGEARCVEVASFFAARLGRRPARETALVIARALGAVGNAWAWETSAVQARGDGVTTRRVAAGALLGQFVAAAADPELREAAAKALLVVAEPGTPADIVAARATADPATQAALDALARRVARNPVARQ